MSNRLKNINNGEGDVRQTKTPRTAGLWGVNFLCVLKARLSGGGKRKYLEPISRSY